MTSPSQEPRPDQSDDPPVPPRPLALIHGVGTSPLDWQDVVSRIGAGQPMAAPWVDGLKPTQSGAFDLARSAAAVTMDSTVMTWPQFDAVGVDVGAMVAATLAVQQPEKVRRLVLSGVHVKVPKLAVRMQKLAIHSATRAKLLAAGIARQRTLAALDSLAGMDLTDTLGAITSPTLVVVGANDRPGKVAAKQVAALVEGCEVAVVPGAGRRPFTETPQAFADTVLGFTRG